MLLGNTPRWTGQFSSYFGGFADTLENFLAQKFNTTKRFGLDGGEAIVPALKDAIDCASELGAHSFVIGMPHCGRLNVLANVMRKPMPLIFSEFQVQ